MNKITVLAGAMLSLSVACSSCNNENNQKLKSKFNMEQKVVGSSGLPTADIWVKSPLRNCLKLKLYANVQEVWAIVGDPRKMPEYSEGLSKVEAEFDDKGNCNGYTCYFKPMEGEKEGVVHHSNMKWYEKNKGWASVDPDDNPFGMLQSLSLMTVQPQPEGTVFTWQFHFNCENEEMLNYNKDGYKKALDDIAQRLIKMFGGTVIENYMEGR
ncbi:MAG: SRPBCC family protein [Cytophagaceae bacterium]